MNALRWLGVLSMLTLFLFLGSATANSENINKHVRLAYLDLPAIKQCQYDGHEILYQRKYGRLVFTDVKNERHMLRISLDGTVMWSLWLHPSKGEGESGERQPVKLILNPAVNKEKAQIERLLPPETWAGYPSTIVLFDEKEEKQTYLAYRKGSGKDDICWSIPNATNLNSERSRKTDDLKWSVLLPLTVPLAVIAYSRKPDKSEICDPHTYYYSVVFSPDGRYIVSGSDDYAVKLWDVRSGDKVRVLTGHTEPVRSVAFSSDGKRILSGSRDKTAKLWDTDTGALIKTFVGHTEMITSVAFSHDDRFAITAGWDHTIRMWDILSGKETKTFADTKTGGGSGSMSINAIEVSPDGRFLLSANSNLESIYRNIESGKKTVLHGHHDMRVNSVAFSPDGKYALSGGSDGTMRLWELASGWQIRSFNNTGSFVAGLGIESVAFSPDGRYGLAGTANNRVILWELKTGKLVRSLDKHTDSVSSVAFSADGKFIVSGSIDETIRLWDGDSGKEIRTFKAKPENIPPKCK